MIKLLSLLSVAAAAALGFAPLAASADPLTPDVWRLAISSTCNSATSCGSDRLDGVWGTLELARDPATGANTGRGRFAECNHDGQAGCGSIEEQITNWWAAAGSAGPDTIYVTGVDVVTLRGQSTSLLFGPADIGLPLAAGHYGTTYRGVEVQVQISHRPGG